MNSPRSRSVAVVLASAGHPHGPRELAPGFAHHAPLGLPRDISPNARVFDPKPARSGTVGRLEHLRVHALPALPLPLRPFSALPNIAKVEHDHVGQPAILVVVSTTRQHPH